MTFSLSLWDMRFSVASLRPAPRPLFLPFPFPLCGLVTTRAADKVTKLLVGIYNAPVLVAGVWLCGGVFEWVVF